MLPQVNLLLDLPKAKQAKFTAILVLQVVCGLAVLLICRAFFDYWQLADYRKQVGELQRVKTTLQQELVAHTLELSKLSDTKELQQKINELKANLELNKQLTDRLADYSVNTVGFSKYLRALSEITTTGVWLTTISLHHGGHNIELIGVAKTSDGARKYMSLLAHQALFKDYEFKIVDITRDKDKPEQLHFSIKTHEQGPT